nr:succinylglutamate desuccinylase [Shewanella intestini]
MAYTLSQTKQIQPPQTFDLPNGIAVDVLDNGVISFTPLNYTKDIILSCAIHGNETAPIEICNQLIDDILSLKIELKQRVMFIIGNPEAILNKSRFIDENLNRLFSGAHSKGQGLTNKERHRAKALEAHVALFFAKNDNKQRIHYDLHTAIKPSKHEKFAIYPYRPGRSYSAEQIVLLGLCGVNTILYHHEPTTTFSYYSSNKFNADAFTVELGKVMPFGENDMQKFAATQTTLTTLLSETNLPQIPFDPTHFNLYKVARSINKHHDDFEFNFSHSTENFTQFTQGELLATEGGQQIRIEHDIEAIVFPNANVPVGQRTVLCLIPAPNEDVT